MPYVIKISVKNCLERLRKQQRDEVLRTQQDLPATASPSLDKTASAVEWESVAEKVDHITG